MTITYINHSAFLAEPDSCTLLFDWYGGELPAVDRTKPLYVFASHHHGDHYSPEIFRYGMENVTYILASCIRLSAKRKAELGIDDSRVHRLTSGKTLELEDLTVKTIRSTDAGVAFLVQVGDKTLFHAGDLNWWHWEEEPGDWNTRMAEAFAKSCKKLQGVAVDAAFLPLDPRQGEAFSWGFDRFMTTMEVKHAFPMHCWGDATVIPRLKALPCSAPYRERVKDITEKGQIFRL